MRMQYKSHFIFNQIERKNFSIPTSHSKKRDREKKKKKKKKNKLTMYSWPREALAQPARRPWQKEREIQRKIQRQKEKKREEEERKKREKEEKELRKEFNRREREGITSLTDVHNVFVRVGKCGVPFFGGVTSGLFFLFFFFSFLFFSFLFFSFLFFSFLFFSFLLFFPFLSFFPFLFLFLPFLSPSLPLSLLIFPLPVLPKSVDLKIKGVGGVSLPLTQECFDSISSLYKGFVVVVVGGGGGVVLLLVMVGGGYSFLF